MTPAKRAPAEGSTFPGEGIAARAKAVLFAGALDELKARDIVLLDVRQFPLLAEYFVIGTGETKRHLRGLAGRVEETAAANGCSVHHAEGYDMARWILIDLHNVLVHIFDEETRAYYELERLWGDAPRLPFEPASR